MTQHVTLGAAHAVDATAGLAVIGAAELQALVPMADAIEIIARAMVDLSAGAVVAPPRWTSPLGPARALGLMPGAYPAAAVFGVKTLSLFGPEARQGLPGHQGLMLLFDLENGRPLAALDANALTGLRTAAASAVATRELARPEARTLALIGHGEQARWHAAAMRCVRPIDEIRVWGRNRQRAGAFADALSLDTPGVIVAPSVADAIRGADVICTLTHAAEPVLHGAWLEPGQHLNLVGSSVAAFREIDDDAVARCLFVADARENVEREGGELRHAIGAGVVDAAHIHAEIGEILAHRAPGRTDASTITAYKSLGHTVQDLAVAAKALTRWRTLKGRSL